jgi:hypothetical protein
LTIYIVMEGTCWLLLLCHLSLFVLIVKM